MILLYAVSIASCEHSVDISSSAGKNSMDRTYRDPHAGRYGANRLVAIVASQGRRTFVVVDDSGATTDVAALAGSL
ncbi:hypothetical protein [Rhodococcus qingshengii]|uniref:hypothetical protein n=1 Tax=Rhodococcus qingshengii TaxID=334542 RepID=UPI0012E8D443|nr:hypothetical protein [Rhodococcus qingshengii]MCE4165072.1 hypothetical protein [Rhodococcus sp. Ni2]